MFDSRKLLIRVLFFAPEISGPYNFDIFMSWSSEVIAERKFVSLNLLMFFFFISISLINFKITLCTCENFYDNNENNGFLAYTVFYMVNFACFRLDFHHSSDTKLKKWLI